MNINDDFGPKTPMLGNSGPAVSRKDIIDSENVVCSCGSKTFKEAIVLKRVSGIVLGEKTVIPLNVIVCDKCGKLAPFIAEDPAMKNIFGKEPEK